MPELPVEMLRKWPDSVGADTLHIRTPTCGGGGGNRSIPQLHFPRLDGKYQMSPLHLECVVLPWQR